MIYSKCFFPIWQSRRRNISTQLMAELRTVRMIGEWSLISNKKNAIFAVSCTWNLWYSFVNKRKCIEIQEKETYSTSYKLQFQRFLSFFSPLISFVCFMNAILQICGYTWYFIQTLFSLCSWEFRIKRMRIRWKALDDIRPFARIAIDILLNVSCNLNVQIIIDDTVQSNTLRLNWQ